MKRLELSRSVSDWRLGAVGFLFVGSHRPAMRRGAFLLALLLVLAPVGATVAGPVATESPVRPATQPPVVAAERNTSEYLALPEGSIQVQRVGWATLDVGGALAADTAGIHVEFDQARVRAAYDRADTATERRRVLRRTADTVAEAIDALVRRERRARRRYNAGDMTTREYLRTLAMVSARANALDHLVVNLSSLNKATAGEPLEAVRLGNMRARLVGHHGPVRELVRAVMSGEGDRTRVYVASGTEGVVLAAVTPEGARYLREAFVSSARAPEAPDTYGQPGIALIERVKELYPWTVRHNQGLSVKAIPPDASVYRIRLPFGHGNLHAYLDGGSDQVYYEVQRKQLGALPTHGSTTVSRLGVVLQVDRTRAGGPLKIRALEPVSGEPIDAAVSVDGVPVGRTGADGTLWTVTPATRFTVTVSTDGRTVSTRVRPSP